ncbi:unnamed protein product, partial [Didymodactylos carnosus]
SGDSLNELVTVLRLSESIKEVRLINCSLRNDFISKLSQFFPQTKFEHLDLSHNPIEDKSLIQLTEKLQQRKTPLITLNLVSCNLTQKSVHVFNTALSNNLYLSRSLTSINLSCNKLKEETDITVLFNNENNIEELQLGDNDLIIENLFHALSTVQTSKLRRLSVVNSVAKSTSTTSTSSSGFVKTFFQKTTNLQILQLINTDLSNEFLREVCDGLHSNIDLKKIDLRLSGNNLETFIHDYAARFASIPSLVTLELTNCELNNELSNFLAELKKNRKLKSLHIGKNFNNIKSKNYPKTIHAIKELLTDTTLESFYIPDSKLRDSYTGELLSALINSPPLKLLDIRGNQMLEHGVRMLTHVLKLNRHLHTVYFDRNSISLNGFEEIVNAMECNNVICYLPVPVNDIIAMKINEKDNRISSLMNKLDAICMRNQNSSQNSSDALQIVALAGTSREAQTCWENQQQLCGDFASMEYANLHGALNRPSLNDLRTTLTKNGRIAKISSQLFEYYIDEEKQLQNECEKICLSLQKTVIEHHERLSKKFYQIFKDQTSFNYDDKFQEQIRTYFQNSNDTTERLLKTELNDKLSTGLRECYISVATCLQKRAYDTANETVTEMRKAMEAATFQTRQNVTNNNNQNHPNYIAIDNLLARNAMFQRMGDASNIVNQDNPSPSQRIKKADSIESLDVTKAKRAVTHVQPDVTNTTDLGSDQRSNSNSNVSSSSPKMNAWRKAIAGNNGEKTEQSLPATDPIYGNVINYGTKQNQQSGSTIDDDGGIIEHDLLALVAKEQEKDVTLKSPEKRKKQYESPPALPKKEGISAKRAPVPTPITSTTNLDVEIESTQKLAHTTKDRPRRQNVRRPAKRSTNGTTKGNESSSDGLITDDDESALMNESSNLVVQQSEPTPPLPEATVITEPPNAKLKSALRTTSRDKPDELKQSQPTQPPPSQAVQIRPSLPTGSIGSANKKDNSDHALSPVGSALSSTGNASLTTATNSTLMSTSLINSDSIRGLSSDNDNEQMIRSAHGGLSLVDENISSEVSSPRPSILARSKLPPGAPRVLPSDTDVPPVRLRHIQAEKKTSLTASPSVSTQLQNPSVPDELKKNESPDINNEQYKRLSVKERAKLLTTNTSSNNNNNNSTAPVDTKRQNSSTSSTEYTFVAKAAGYLRSSLVRKQKITVSYISRIEIMSHTILLIQPTSDPLTRTYSDYESQDLCFEIIIKMFEEHLLKYRSSTSSQLSIVYHFNDLSLFIDSIQDLSLFIYKPLTATYEQHDKVSLKKILYAYLKKQGQQNDASD